MDKVVPIIYKLNSTNALKSNVATEVTYRVKGPRIFVRKLLDRKDEIIIDVSKHQRLRRNEYRVNLNRHKIKLPLGLELLSFSPRIVPVSLDKKVKKSFPVKLNIDPRLNSLNPKKTFSFSPARIEVQGARSLLKDIKQIDTVLIDSIDSTQNSSKEVLLDPISKNITFLKKSILLSYKKETAKTEFTLSKIPIIFQSSRLIRSRSTSTVSIKIAGSKDIIEGINKESIQVFANIPNTGKSSMAVDLLTELPPGIELLEIFPNKVSIKLETDK